MHSDGFHRVFTCGISDHSTASGEAPPTSGLMPISTGQSAPLAPHHHLAARFPVAPLSHPPMFSSRRANRKPLRVLRSRRTNRHPVQPPRKPRNQAGANQSGRTCGTGRSCQSGDAKDAIAPEIVYDDPGAFHFTVEAGYSSKHLWRGIDLAQFTSANYAISTGLPQG